MRSIASHKFASTHAGKKKRPAYCTRERTPNLSHASPCTRVHSRAGASNDANRPQWRLVDWCVSPMRTVNAHALFKTTDNAIRQVRTNFTCVDPNHNRMRWRFYST